MNTVETVEKNKASFRTLGFLAGWLVLPILAIRHKVRRVSYYEIESDNLKLMTALNYVHADMLFYALLDLNYGEYIKLTEFRKNGDAEILISIEW
tara:strand:+ start:4106 stop:4390 length:285 start_codon:yes stop_codon:yes gene_type:complete